MHTYIVGFVTIRLKIVMLVYFFNPLYSDGFHHTDKSNEDVIRGGSGFLERGFIYYI